MKAKLLLCLLCALTLTACSDSDTAKGYSYTPPSASSEATEATQEETAVVPEETEVIPEESSSTDDSAQLETAPIHNVEVSAADAATDDPNVIEISEKVFIAQINDIYFNFEDYADKTIIVEGMYAIFYAWDEQLSSPAVYRNGPGCCGNDGWGGFMLNYDGELPEINDWIRVTGTPELVTAYDGYVDLFLNVTSLEVLDVRGAEYVAQ